jgi:hypothetical protein
LHAEVVQLLSNATELQACEVSSMNLYRALSADTQQLQKALNIAVEASEL